MVRVRPYEDLSAMAVLSRLDPFDQIEAEAVRGEVAPALALFADWRGMRGAWVGSWVIETEGCTPFALLALANTGQAGVAGAALLARDHRRYRRELVALSRLIRAEMPGFCKGLGIRRIEARSWAGHPRAAAFLRAVGFRHEADMPGFGRDGTLTFRQFTWLSPGLPVAAPSDPRKD